MQMLVCTLHIGSSVCHNCFLDFSTAVSTPSGNCSDGDLRLVGGSDNLEQGTREGRIEICINNAWGTVCRTVFGIPDAQVACYELGGFHREGKDRSALEFSNMIL